MAYSAETHSLSRHIPNTLCKRPVIRSHRRQLQCLPPNSTRERGIWNVVLRDLNGSILFCGQRNAGRGVHLSRVSRRPFHSAQLPTRTPALTLGIQCAAERQWKTTGCSFYEQQLVTETVPCGRRTRPPAFGRPAARCPNASVLQRHSAAVGSGRWRRCPRGFVSFYNRGPPAAAERPAAHCTQRPTPSLALVFRSSAGEISQVQRPTRVQIAVTSNEEKHAKFRTFSATTFISCVSCCKISVVLFEHNWLKQKTCTPYEYIHYSQ